MVFQPFLSYLILNAISINANIIVTAFASIIDILSLYIPYTNQRTIPKKNIENIGNESPDTSFVFQVLYTCGTKEVVVKKAATRPIISMLSISVNILVFEVFLNGQKYAFRLFKHIFVFETEYPIAKFFDSYSSFLVVFNPFISKMSLTI